MQPRTATVPFADILGESANEIDFGPDDFAVVRPLYSHPGVKIRDLLDRINALGRAPAIPPDSSPEERQRLEDAHAVAQEEEGDRILLDMLDLCIVTWSLYEDGVAVPMPRTPDALNRLPSALRGALYVFLMSFRGKGPNPTKPA